MMTATIGQRPRQRDADADGRGKKKERAEMDPPNEVWTDERTGERSEGADGQIDWGGRGAPNPMESCLGERPTHSMIGWTDMDTHRRM